MREDWSKMTLKQSFGYWLVRHLGRLQQLVHHLLINEIVWRTSQGKCIPLSKLTDRHLGNCIAMLSQQGDQGDMLAEMLAIRTDRDLALSMSSKCGADD